MRIESLLKAKPSDTLALPYRLYRFRSGMQKLVRVKTGIQSDKYIQIEEVLEENVEAVSGSYRAISRTPKNGEKIKVVKERTKTE